LAKVILENLFARGLSQAAVKRITGVCHETQRRVLRTGELKRAGEVLERLVVLQIVARQFPIWERPATGARHPDEERINRRYQALREAYA
jgi:hypothetical protein